MSHTEKLDVRDPAGWAHALSRAADLLRAGQLVAFPTETVYGLGANALDPQAVRAIFTAKGRPANNPVIVHVPDRAGIGRVASDWPEVADRLARAFWPGPLSLVLPRGVGVPDEVTGGGPTVAVRIPAHPVALALLRAADVPIAAPSANRSNRLSPTRAEHVLRDLDGLVPLILDGGPTGGGLESTVLDVTCQPPRLLRPGLIDPAALEAVIGPILRGAEPMPESRALPSPGMLTRHYAPRTRLECLEGSGADRVAELTAEGVRIGWVRRGAGEAISRPGVLVLTMPEDPAGYAAGLYSTLHDLDQLALDRILVELPPPTDAWLAVRDRLRRASA